MHIVMLFAKHLIRFYLFGFVEVQDEMLATMKADDHQQEAYKRRMYRHKSQYSLDSYDGIENDALYREPSSEEVYHPVVALCIYT